MGKSTKVTSSPDDEPNVVAYRVGQLEETQTKGFTHLGEQIAALHAKFDAKLSGLATVDYVDKIANTLATDVDKVDKKLTTHTDASEKTFVTRREVRVLTGISAGIGTVLLIVFTVLLYFKTHG